MQSEATNETRKRRVLPRRLSTDEQRQLFTRTAVDQTVTTDEGAVLLNLAPQTMRRWSCDGSGPIRPIKVNGRLRWSVADIQALLKGESPAPAAA